MTKNEMSSRPSSTASTLVVGRKAQPQVITPWNDFKFEKKLAGHEDGITMLLVDQKNCMVSSSLDKTLRV
jgi:hypothetical protein